MDIEIKEFKGLWTFGDQDDIPSEYLSVCKNAISKFGKLIKTYGFYNFDASQVAINPTGTTVYGMVCHVDSNYTDSGTPPASNGYCYWLVCVDSSNVLKIYFYRSLVHQWVSLALTNTYYHKAALRNPIITTFDAVRFLPGNVGLADGTHESKGLWYGYIDRDYFWNSAIATKAGFHESITTPQIATTLINSVTSGVIAEAIGTLATGTYYYKLTLVFDGTQETLLPVAYKSQAVTSPDTIYLQYKMLLSAFNYRVTGVNIYRSDTSAVSDYKLIKQISTLDATYDANLEYNTGSVVGYGLYVPDKAWSSMPSWKILVRGATYLSSGVRVISSNTTDTIIVSSVLSNNLWNTGSFCAFRVDYNIFDPVAGYDFETGDVGDWTAGGGIVTLALDGAQHFNGSQSLKIEGSDYVTWDDSIALNSGTTYHITLATMVTAGTGIELEISEDGLSWSSVWTNPNSDSQWYVGHYSFTGWSAIYIRFNVDGTAYVDYMTIVDAPYAVYETGLYGGINTIIDSDFDFDRNDNLIGYRALVGTNANGNNDASAERFRIIHNVQRAVQLHTGVSAPYRGNNLKSYICNDYLWQDSATAGCVDLWFYDDGINAGSAHPLEDEVSIKVNGKFARILNDRLYQYNVVLDPGGKNESRPNGLTYSEINDSNIGSQFDVNPVSNFITLPDREGGEGTGLAVQFGGLIAFKKRAIFRLIPDATTGDATDIRESKYNEGNIAPNGYVEAGNDVYYCAYSSINRLNPNIGAETEATPLAQDRISEPIKDVYMALTDSQKELIQAEFDQLNNEIVYRFKNDSTYAYKIDTGEWREIDSALYVDNMGLDESSNLMIYDNTNKKVYKVTSDLSATDATKEAVAFNIRTKEFYIGDDEKSQVVRYFFIVYKSAVALTLNMYADNDNTTVVSTTTIPASTVVTQLRLAVRYWCGRFVMEVLESSGSYSAVEIHSMKIVTD